MSRCLVVTAVAAERDAVLGNRSAAIGMVDGLEMHRCSTRAGLLDVVVAGVGPVAAAVATCCALRHGYDIAVSAGIAGGFAGIASGSTVVADTVVHADLGAQTLDGFTDMAELGWGAVRFGLPAQLATELAERCHARLGAILSVSTTTGSHSRAESLRTANPDAVAEAMEGIGVYTAAAKAGVAFAEIRTISNPVGPRDLGQWQIPQALAALTRTFDSLLSAPIDSLVAA